MNMNSYDGLKVICLHLPTKKVKNKKLAILSINFSQLRPWTFFRPWILLLQYYNRISTLISPSITNTSQCLSEFIYLSLSDFLKWLPVFRLSLSNQVSMKFSCFIFLFSESQVYFSLCIIDGVLPGTHNKNVHTTNAAFSVT